MLAWEAAKNEGTQILMEYEQAVSANLDYLLVRWIAQMTAVEIHTIWECYVEERLVAALNHRPSYFLSENSVRGVSRVSAGLGLYIVRGGGRYFDFRSISELMNRADRLIGGSHNPFRTISTGDRAYIDALSTVRNYVVHGSEAAVTSYKRVLRAVYGIHAAPKPDEFLNARDFRASSPARYQSRLHGLLAVVRRVIQNT